MQSDYILIPPALVAQELEEESLRDNFVIVYELLDEVMDYGYPQFTEAKILSEWVKRQQLLKQDRSHAQHLRRPA
jgi:AP-1 complex subunit mu